MSSETKYYFGPVEISSPDGQTSYGKTSSLVKRIIDPAAGQITEIVLQPSRDPSQVPKDIVTTLTRIGTSDIFSAVDDGHTFTGELTFSGPEWRWDQWTYKIQLADGSRIEGSGGLDPQAITTTKAFYKPDGSVSVLLKENLKSISLQDYNRQHAKMVGQ